MFISMTTVFAIAVCWVIPAALYYYTNLLAKNFTYELHAYQVDFLQAMAAAKLPAVEKCAKEDGVSGAAAALQAIALQAMQDQKVRATMYDTFHCVHCGSKNPAAWIKDRKGTKEPYHLAVTPPVAAFLATALLVPVQKLGEPPVRQVVDGPRHADSSKAARVAIDWAIQAYDALLDGKPKAKAGAKAAQKSPKRAGTSPKRR